MTKTLPYLELEENNFNASTSSENSNFISNSTEMFIDSKIIREEEKLMTENEEIEMIEKYEALVETHGNELTEYAMTEEDLMKEREAEIKERRYKKLMHLLNSSKMYSTILKDRLKSEKKEKKTTNNKQNKKKSECGYQIGDIISEESIDRSRYINEEKQLKVEDEDYFTETRITELGFTVSCKQPLLLEGAVMRGYQLQGLEWLKVLFTSGVNGILADEMGLGKTIQVISFICHMIELDITGPFLIVAPLSTVNNWLSEFKRFAPKVPTMLYHGTKEEREILFSKIYNTHKVWNKSVHNVIITSYHVPLKDKKELEKINWYYLIVDEGHRIKNYNSQLSRVLRQFNTIGRLLLTGTPLQNDLSELWSLLNFLLPEVFNTLDVFESWFDIKELETNGAKFMSEKFNINVVSILQEILVPFLLRREKKDVALELPPKKEVLIYCTMASRQKELYESVLDKTIELLLKPKENVDIYKPLAKRKCFLVSPYGKSSGKMLKSDEKNDSRDEKEKERFLTNSVFLNPQMQLRKIVNHPYLIQFPLIEGTEELRIDEDLVKESGKMLVLDALLAKLKAGGHKVVVFSYFKIVLDILEEHAIMRGYKYCRLDGQIKLADRDEEIKNFMTDPEIFVFYITMRSGGLGINLTAADTVVFFDSDWNPTVHLQSEDRCHRIGQTKPVLVFTLCAKGTIDEKMIERGNAKKRLKNMILQKGKFTQNSKNSKSLNLMDLKELKQLLESTDHDTVINSNGFVLSDEQLGVLLDRSDLSNAEGSDRGMFQVLNFSS